MISFKEGYKQYVGTTIYVRYNSFPFLQLYIKEVTNYVMNLPADEFMLRPDNTVLYVCETFKKLLEKKTK